MRGEKPARTPDAARPAVPIALAALSGAVLGGSLPDLALGLALGLAVALGAAAFALARGRASGLARPRAVAALVAAVVALGAARRLDARAEEDARTRVFRSLEGEEAIVKVRTLREYTARAEGIELPAEVESGWLGEACDRPVPAGLRVLVRLGWDARRRAGDLLPGRRVELQGVLVRPGRARVPGGFDQEAELRREGVGLVLEVETAWRLEGRTVGPASLLARAGRRVRAAIREADLPRDEEAIVRALVLGDRGILPREARDAFVATATIHAITISGLHVAILAVLLAAIVRPLPIGRVPRAAVVALGLVAYAGLAGPHPGVIRATIGGVLFALGGATGRGGDGWNRLAVALVAVLGWDPASVEDPGFQLTFGTVAGMLALAPALGRALAPRTRAEGRLAWLASKVRRELTATLAAFLAHTPLVVLRFGQVSPVVLVANLPAIPLTALALALGLGGGALGIVRPGLGAPLFRLAGLAARALLAVVEALARLPLARIELARPSSAATVLAAGVLALAFARRSRAIAAVAALFWLAAALPQPRGLPALAPGATPPERVPVAAPVLVVFPAQGGLAALLVLADGRSVRIGAGGGANAERALELVAHDASGPLAPSLTLTGSVGAVRGLPPGLAVTVLGATAVRVEANGESVLVLGDPGGRELSRLLRETPEGLLRASVLVAPARPSVALAALVRETRPPVTVVPGLRAGSAVAGALRALGVEPIELSTLGAVSIALDAPFSVRAFDSPGGGD
jgi:ComEC/Rec2-related protein